MHNNLLGRGEKSRDVKNLEKAEEERRNVFYLHQVIPGEQWKSDVLHQFGHVLQTSRLIVLDPRYHSFKYLGERDGETWRERQRAVREGACKYGTCANTRRD